MELLVSSPARDFDFDFNGGRTTSPYLSLPSSPNRFGDCYLSAPASPSRFYEFVSEFEYVSATPKHDDDDYSFAFDVSRESEKSSLSAEDLFDGGKIKALKPPSRLRDDEFASVKSPLVSPRQSRSPMKVISDAFSPKKKETQERRGRDRTPTSISSSNSGRRASRSLSPYRNSDYGWEEERYLPQQQRGSKEAASSSSNSKSLLTSSSGNSKSSRKWRLRDLLLFRSASEGHGSNKDPLRKYSVAYRRPEEAKTSSFRSVDSPTAAHGSKRRGAKSAHELHYAMKKAETQDLKKKTFLPYKQGILGALAGFGSSPR
ncbi:uncharacterized protein LOC114758120 [Neltuma alba]|uniref:uncharacterized protein LOC114747213 n=1 Tax=Neltuma alba TaxID=207710 RepID=UPI0010A54B96|nr:uncharacterized protein LOC114747213 [Prosopis alba]XP_028802965.1 uncharacterized protein LOC114758120 [Prosopis alba]